MATDAVLFLRFWNNRNKIGNRQIDLKKKPLNQNC